MSDLEKLQKIETELRELRDSQTTIVCDENNCSCYLFDNVLDQMEVTILEFQMATQ